MADQLWLQESRNLTWKQHTDIQYMMVRDVMLTLMSFTMLHDWR